jgi:hypothetical protein
MTDKSTKRGRPAKSTVELVLQVHPKNLQWLEALLDRGHYGTSVEDIAAKLLNERFRQMIQDKELHENSKTAETIPFIATGAPNGDINSSLPSTSQSHVTPA